MEDVEPRLAPINSEIRSRHVEEDFILMPAPPRIGSHALACRERFIDRVAEMGEEPHAGNGRGARLLHQNQRRDMLCKSTRTKPDEESNAPRCRRSSRRDSHSARAGACGELAASASRIASRPSLSSVLDTGEPLCDTEIDSRNSLRGKINTTSLVESWGLVLREFLVLMLLR